MIKAIGVLIMLNALVVVGIWLYTRPSPWWPAAAVGLLAILVGALLFFHAEVQEVTVSLRDASGTFKLRERAGADADAIASIKDRVEAQSATVDLVAQKAAQAEALSQDLSKKSAEAEHQLAELARAIDDANKNLDRTKRLTDFTAIITAAQSDDRKAFEQLKKWGEDKTFEYYRLAHQAWFAILEKHAPTLYTEWSYPTQGTQPLAAAEISVIIDAYWKAPIHARPSSIYFLVQRRDIPKMERLSFLADVMKKETHLLPMEHAGRLLSRAGKIPLKPLAIDELVALWEEHKNDEAYWRDPAEK